MEIIFRIDDFIIVELEKFTHKFQLWTGKNNFWLARLFWGLWCVSFIISFPNPMIDTVICLLAFGNVLLTIGAEKLLLDTPNVLNREKIWPIKKGGRVLLISFTIIEEINNWKIFLDVMGLISSHDLLFLVLALYFGALNPLPPGKNKIKELAKTIIKFFKESKVAVPVPEAAG